MLQSQSGIKGTGVNPRGQLVLGSNQRQEVSSRAESIWEEAKREGEEAALSNMDCLERARVRITFKR